MKNNFEFFSIVLVLLLASSIVLMGCMYAIAAENGDAKVYDMGSQISADSNIIVDDDTPTSQTELQKKFSAMYDISEDGKTITVISEEFLNDYWQELPVMMFLLLYCFLLFLPWQKVDRYSGQDF